MNNMHIKFKFAEYNQNDCIILVNYRYKVRYGYVNDKNNLVIMDSRTWNKCDDVLNALKMCDYKFMVDQSCLDNEDCNEQVLLNVTYIGMLKNIIIVITEDNNNQLYDNDSYKCYMHKSFLSFNYEMDIYIDEKLPLSQCESDFITDGSDKQVILMDNNQKHHEDKIFVYLDNDYKVSAVGIVESERLKKPFNELSNKFHSSIDIYHLHSKDDMIDLYFSRIDCHKFEWIQRHENGFEKEFHGKKCVPL